MRWVLACVALLGCTDDRNAVNGRFVDRLYTSHGVVERPTDSSTRAYRIYSNGRWYPDYGLVPAASDGTVYIPDVPDGPYLLNAVYSGGAMTWHMREDHAFVDVAVRTGRPDAQPATSVPLELQLDNLAPWDGYDDLHVNCYENGTEQDPYELEGQLAAGATQLQGTIDWASTFSGPLASANTYPTAYLLDRNAGDTLTISRVANVSRTGLGVHRLTQVARGPAPTQRDGEPSSFAGTFVDVPPTITQQFTIDVPAMASQLPDVSDWSVSLGMSPGSVEFDTFGRSLLIVGGTATATATEPITFTESYGDPFDADWQLVASGLYITRDLLVLPDGRPVYSPWPAYATEQRHVEPGADFTFQPTLAFVASASLDGHPLAGDVPWDGASPLSFHVDVPDGAAGFIADVLWMPAGATYPEPWTTLRSHTADVSLPADAFQFGVEYLVRVAVTNETETSRSATYRLLGPFRLVRQ